MTSAQAIDLASTSLLGANLIEASAGTGKTYTIAALYVRLIVEAARRVDQILVVTFTNAATEELKSRIRKRLVDAYNAFSSGHSDDDFCQRLLSRIATREDRETALRRLQNAVRGFDQAAIFTIHSFCQRVLADKAFASGMSFETELLTDVHDLSVEIVEDFWRQRFYDAAPILVRYLLDKGYSPERLYREIKPHLGKPYLHILSVEDATETERIEAVFNMLYKNVQAQWSVDRETVANLLLESAALNGNQYRKGSIPGWIGALDQYLMPEIPGLQPFKQFRKFAVRGLHEATKKGLQPPEHGFFVCCEEFLSSHDELVRRYELRLKALRAELLDYCNRELATRKQRARLQSYDDLLANLYTALHSKLGASLASSIRKRYCAALIDEFQDTDPVQYDIFSQIYADSDVPVFFVGDPKQAIYSFRGADIFAYLKARGDADRVHTLDRNWRSEPALIDAVNRLFTTTDNPFLFADIPFHSVAAAHQEHAALNLPDRAGSALCIWFVAGDADDKPLPKTEALERVASASAAEISTLLNAAARTEASIGTRPLSGGDIAVLVRTHRQGALMRRALLANGVASVQHAQDNVFASLEAQEVHYVLNAIAEPGRETFLRAALSTVMLGMDGRQIVRLERDNTLWEQVIERFYQYHDLWRDSGFMQMFQTLLKENDVARRLLALGDGERRLTNLSHLAELLHDAALKQHLGVEGLVQWLLERRHSDLIEDEEHQLRLDSDAHLVQIVTVHKSKGLEYPIVFCPFLWDGRLHSAEADIIAFHDPDDDFNPALDFGSLEQDQRRPYAKNEELAENLRLLYVALTRARLRCYLAWGHISEAGGSPLAWLLHHPPVVDPNSDNVTATRDRYEAMGCRALREEVEKIADQGRTPIAVVDLPAAHSVAYRPPRAHIERFEARAFSGPPRVSWRISSFTALTSQRAAETPDYDASAWHYASAGNKLDIFGFPRGARAGRCLHQIFEHWDFAASDDQALRELVGATLAEYGFDAVWVPVIAEMVETVLATRLSAHCAGLAGLSARQRLNELEFYYPLAAIEAESLNQLFERYALRFRRLDQETESLTFAPLSGFMKGYIDLVFESDGKFYIVDYKSNWLGASLADYGSASLDQVMVRDSYDFQSLIYTIALHRYLRLRLPKYNYRDYFGGVFYLFLRGMQPGSSNGVVHYFPEPELVSALDRYFATAQLGGG